MRIHLILPFLTFLLTAHANDETEVKQPQVLLSLGLKLNSPTDERSIELNVKEGETIHDAIYTFALENNVDSGSLFSVKQQLDLKARRHSDPTVQEQVCKHPNAKNHLMDANKLVAEGKKQILKGQYRKAGHNFLHAVPAQNSQEKASGTLVESMDIAVKAARMVQNLEKLECTQQNYLDLLKQLMDISPKNGDYPLKIAKCHAERGDFSLALQTTASVLKATGTKGRWKDHQSRTKAVLLAHSMSLELGDIEAASKKLSVALRSDPENCDSIKTAFNKLKQLRKKVKSSKKDLKKTYNKRALEALTSALEMSKDYNLTTGVLKGKLMLDICLATARVRRHEQALIVCNEAIELTNVTMDGLFMDTGQLASAFIARGESLVADYDYSEAVRDFRRATEIASSGSDTQKDARQKQENAHWKAQEWEKNPNRIKILGLPINFDQIPKKSQCAWLRKSFKKMVLKWHPDKNKGNPKRAARKFDEVTAAKKVLAQQLGCRERRRL
jgi:tetratricopeptide (TPR) repeat protein